jgi:hypothetical protein
MTGKYIFLIALLIQRIFLLKRGSIGYDGYKKVKGVKLSVLVDYRIYLYILSILKFTPSSDV